MDYDLEAHIADLDDLDTETQLAYLPPCLRLLLKSFRSKGSRSDDSLKHAMIGQAIVKMTKKTPTPQSLATVRLEKLKKILHWPVRRREIPTLRAPNSNLAVGLQIM